jgi:hypothetical protein
MLTDAVGNYILSMVTQNGGANLPAALRGLNRQTINGDVVADLSVQDLVTQGKLDTLISNMDGLEGMLGAINESAPLTDTAPAGQNGRLQRIAQHLTTAIGHLSTIAGRLPTLGPQTKANSLSSTLPSDLHAGAGTPFWYSDTLAVSPDANNLTTVTVGSVTGSAVWLYGLTLQSQQPSLVRLAIYRRNAANSAWEVVRALSLDGLKTTSASHYVEKAYKSGDPMWRVTAYRTATQTEPAMYTMVLAEPMPFEQGFRVDVVNHSITGAHDANVRCYHAPLV